MFIAPTVYSCQIQSVFINEERQLVERYSITYWSSKSYCHLFLTRLMNEFGIRSLLNLLQVVKYLMNCINLFDVV